MQQQCRPPRAARWATPGLGASLALAPGAKRCRAMCARVSVGQHRGVVADIGPLSARAQARWSAARPPADALPRRGVGVAIRAPLVPGAALERPLGRGGCARSTARLGIARARHGALPLPPLASSMGATIGGSSNSRSLGRRSWASAAAWVAATPGVAARPLGCGGPLGRGDPHRLRGPLAELRRLLGAVATPEVAATTSVATTPLRRPHGWRRPHGPRRPHGLRASLCGDVSWSLKPKDSASP